MLHKIKFYSIIFCLLGMVAIVASCKKSKDDPAPAASTFSYSQAQYEKRWNVSNAQRTSGAPTSTLIAVEFVSGVYVLYFPNDSIATGTYTTSGKDVITLNGLGTLTINTLTDTQFGFTLTINNSTQTFTSSVATQAIADSDHTTKLCKTWKLTGYTIWYADSTITESPKDSEVTFNKYGTYLLKDTDGGVSDIQSNTWMWTNAKQDSICYGAWDGGNISDCNGLGTVSIDMSSDAKSLTMVEVESTFGIKVEYRLTLK